jgi:hypothetical protein
MTGEMEVTFPIESFHKITATVTKISLRFTYHVTLTCTQCAAGQQVYLTSILKILIGIGRSAVLRGIVQSVTQVSEVFAGCRQNIQRKSYENRYVLRHTVVTHLIHRKRQIYHAYTRFVYIIQPKLSVTAAYFLQ